LARFDLNLLASLDALLSERSVTAAADRQGVSQSTMSGMLNRLRLQLQDPLLVRVGSGYELTSRARQLATQLRQTLLKIDGLVATRSGLQLANVNRHLKVMASEYVMLFLLPQMFRRAMQTAPALSFEVVPIDDPVQAVYNGDVDLCLTGRRIEDVQGGAASAIRTQALMRENFVGLVDEKHPIQSAITMEHLLIYPYVATHFPGRAYLEEESGVDQLTKRQPPAIRVPSFVAIGPLLAHTRMIGVVPAAMAPLMCSLWSLRTLELPTDFPSTAIRMLWHGRLDRDPVHEMLRSLATEACSALNTPSR